jgi:6-phosphofructokinase
VPDLVSGNAAIGQSGGPTAVVNQSLAGVIEGLRAGLAASGKVGRIFGMRHGVRGLIKPSADGLLDLTALDKAKLEAIARTPSAALGSTRDKPDEAYCEKILASCRKNDIRYFFYIGGNDSADTCRIVSEKALAAGYELRCFHVPKTIDNDLLENDHTPGFPSAARYVALALMGDALDNASLGGIKINVIMGRNAGFLTAAAALARSAAPDGALPPDRPAPHLIYLPEVPFSTDGFLADVEAVYAKLGRCQIAASEGIRDAEGGEIGPKLMRGPGEVDAHGNVQLSGSGALGDGLADLVKTALTPKGGKGPRVRADTFGYIQRCWPEPSPDSRPHLERARRLSQRLRPRRPCGCCAAHAARTG